MSPAGTRRDILGDATVLVERPNRTTGPRTGCKERTGQTADVLRNDADGDATGAPIRKTREHSS